MPTTNSCRSSLSLRNRKVSSKIQLVDTPKTTKNEVSKPADNNFIKNHVQSISKSCESPLIVQAQAQFNISPSQNTIKNETTEMRNTIEMLRKDLMKSICETENKEKYYNNIVSQLQREIKDIKTFNLFLLTQIRVGSFSNRNHKQNLGFYRMHDNNDFEQQIAEMSRVSIDDSNIFQIIEVLTSKNNELSNEIKKINDELNKVNIANNNVHSQSKLINNESDFGNRITALENGIDDINISIKNVYDMCSKSNDAWPIMNNQLHVLSAKFINFNSKMNEFLFNFKNNDASISKEINIVDEDVIHFTTYNQSSIKSYGQINQSKRSKNKIAVKESNIVHMKNNFISSDKINQRIHGISNKFDYTRCIKIAMQNTNIFDLSMLPNEIHRYFNSTFGGNLTESVNINKFSMSIPNNVNNIIDSVSFYVSFKEPLSYDFLCSFKFPSNWFFISTKKIKQNR